MKAIGCLKYLSLDDPDCFVQLEIPTPEPTGRDLLVRVKAISVNPVDTKVRASITEATPKPVVLGWDAAGIVEGVGEAAELFRPGDEVFYAGSRARPGCNCEYHLVDERIVGRKPGTFTFEEAAALPLTSITAWEALFDRLGIHPAGASQASPKTLLIIGGAGGVGSIAIQLAKRIAGLRVIATASRLESASWCKLMGADTVVDRREPLPRGLNQANVPAVDFILCLNSTEHYVPEMAEIILPQGKICAIVRSKGDQPLPMNGFFEKSVTFAWEYMFTRPVWQTSDLQEQHKLLEEIGHLVDRGKIRSTMKEHLGGLSVEALRRAHAQIESGETIGKIVLSGL